MDTWTTTSIFSCRGRCVRRPGWQWQPAVFNGSWMTCLEFGAASRHWDALWHSWTGTGMVGVIWWPLFWTDLQHQRNGVGSGSAASSTAGAAWLSSAGRRRAHAACECSDRPSRTEVLGNSGRRLLLLQRIRCHSGTTCRFIGGQPDGSVASAW